MPDFSDMRFQLQRLANLVVADITHGIITRRSITGGAQKRNKTSTIVKKGHDHPLIGGSPQSPMLALKSTYTVKASDTRVTIAIKPKRADVAGYVEKKGFLFFKKEEIHLTGTVQSEVDKRKAEEIARHSAAGRELLNEIEVANKS